jgi:hypothetical protein
MVVHPPGMAGHGIIPLPVFGVSFGSMGGGAGSRRSGVKLAGAIEEAVTEEMKDVLATEFPRNSPGIGKRLLQTHATSHGWVLGDDAPAGWLFDEMSSDGDVILGVMGITAMYACGLA